MERIPESPPAELLLLEREKTPMPTSEDSESEWTEAGATKQRASPPPRRAGTERPVLVCVRRCSFLCVRYGGGSRAFLGGIGLRNP